MGAGADRTWGGGGGGGAVIKGVDQSLNRGTYQVIVGKGGKGPPAQGHYKINSGSNGGNSSFNGYIANGGGYGGSGVCYFAPTYGYGNDGGCGGGGSGYHSANGGDGRNGSTNQSQYSGLPGITVYSNHGGANGGYNHYSGGGGGAGAIGTQGSSGNIPNGGDGIQNNLYNGINYYWAGGGGGSGYSQDGGNGGKGGGGGGAVGTTTGGEGINYGNPGGGGVRNQQTNKPGGDAGENTGGGGGGGSHYNLAKGGDGGSGIVIIRYKKEKHNKLSLYRGLTNNISTNNFTDLDKEGLQLEFVVGVNNSSSPEMWKPIFASSGNDITKSCNSGSDGDLINTTYWRYDLTNGFTQISNYGLKVWAYVDDAIMNTLDNTLDTTINSVLTYEIWIKLTNDRDFLSDTDNAPRGWIMSYETGWGPAIVLKDDRINNSSYKCVGVTPGSDTHSGFESGYYGSNRFNANFGNNGSHGQPKDGWDHIIGYWHNGGGTGRWEGGDKDNNPPFSSPGGKGCYINKYNIWQNPSYSSGVLQYPSFDRQDRQLALGNYASHNISESGHHCKGVSIYSFRIWYKKLDQTLINKLYEAGPKGVVSDV